VVFTVTACSFLTEIALEAVGRCSEKLKRLVDKVGTPVKELTAAKFGNCLPVISVLEAVLFCIYFVNLTELTAVDNFLYSVESSFKSSLLVNKESGSAALICLFIKSKCLFVRDCSRLFKKNVLACFKRHHCVHKMVAGTGCNVNHFDVFLL